MSGQENPSDWSSSWGAVAKLFAAIILMVVGTILAYWIYSSLFMAVGMPKQPAVAFSIVFAIITFFLVLFGSTDP